MKNLVIRAISGLILVIIIIGAIVMSIESRYVVLLLIGVISLREIFKLFSKANIEVALGGYYAIISSILLFYLFCLDSPLLFSSSAFVLIIIRFIIELYRKKERPIDAIAYEIFAVIYAFVPMAILTQIDDYRVIIAILILVWTNDVGAYLVGSTIGKHRLFKRLSPKKSWEGFIGGIILVITVSILIHKYWLESDNNIITGLVLAIFISVAAVFGDLFESMFKRSIGVKDSGNSIPGHGGFLDRFDALFFAIPIYFSVDYFLKLFYS